MPASLSPAILPPQSWPRCTFLSAMSGPLKIDNTFVSSACDLQRCCLISILKYGRRIYWRRCSCLVSPVYPLLSSNCAYLTKIYRLWGGQLSCFSESLVPSESDCVTTVSCVQVWYYHDMYPKDHWCLKLLVHILSFRYLFDFRGFPQVTAVLTFDTIHQVLITHTSAWIFAGRNDSNVRPTL